MNKILFSVCILLSFFSFINSNKCYCQVSINNSGTPPNQFAMLDINSEDKGVLVPRMNLVDTAHPISGAKPAGLLVWNDNAGFDKGKGFYFWTGTQWHPVLMIYKAGNGITIDSTSHTISSTTGVLNTVNTDGIVPAPTSSKRYAEYKTDFKGNPAWKKQNRTMYYIEEF